MCRFSQTEIIVNAAYLGDEVQGTTMVKPLLDLAPSLVNISEVTFATHIAAASFGADTVVCEAKDTHSLYGLGVAALDPEALVMVVNDYDEMYKRYPETQSSVVLIFDYPTQAAQALSNNATAYPWREIGIWM